MKKNIVLVNLFVWILFLACGVSAQAVEINMSNAKPFLEKYFDDNTVRFAQCSRGGYNVRKSTVKVKNVISVGKEVPQDKLPAALNGNKHCWPVKVEVEVILTCAIDEWHREELEEKYPLTASLAVCEDFFSDMVVKVGKKK